jgi:hypothetical protein
MNWAHHLQRVLGAVIIMIACLTASPAAFAHTGHERADAAQITGTPAAILDGMALGTHGAVIPMLKAEAETSSLPDSAKRCVGGCCTSSHACCAVSLPMNAGALAVPYTSASVALVEPPFRDGLDPEALRKPPRSFA